VERLRRKFSVSERRACQGVGFSRTSIRYRRRTKNDEPVIRKRLHELARQRPRFGYRQMTRLLRLEGFRVSFKRVHRIWKAEGLKVRQKPKKKRAKGQSKNACHRLRAERINHVWTWDFIFDRTTTGHSLKWLSIVDEHTRQCITLDVGRSMTSEDVINRLAELFVMYGVPECIRSDNGPEFIAKAIQQWLTSLDVKTLYVEPGSPWQNGYAESFHSRLRDELLNMEEFDSVRHARAHATAWREDYNGYRPHSSLGGLPPDEFARRCADYVPAAPPLHQHSETKPVTQPVLS
jgi:transposase InsO family protein